VTERYVGVCAAKRPMQRTRCELFQNITNKMQRYTIYLFLWNSLHVPGGSSAHHQELKTVFTASGTLSNFYCYTATVVAVNSKSLTKYPMLYIQFWAPDDGRRNRLKHVEHFTEINKLCNVASCWLYFEICLRCTDPWTSKIGVNSILHGKEVNFTKSTT